MSAGDSLSPQQFAPLSFQQGDITHKYEHRHALGTADVHKVTATHTDASGVQTPAGSLDWVQYKGSMAGRSPEIERIKVDPGMRRRGIASGMFAAARAAADIHGIAEPEHSPVRTPDGDAWAHAVSPKKRIPGKE